MDKNTQDTEEQKPENQTEESPDSFEQAQDESVGTETKPSYEEDVAESKKTNFLKKFSKRTWAIICGLVIIAGLLTYYGLTNSGDEKTSSNTEPQKTVEAEKPLGAEASLLEGMVEIQGSGNSWKKLEASTAVKEGDRIRTSTNGRLVIAIDDGSAIRLNNNSEILIRSLTVKNIEISNEKGEVYSRVTPIKDRMFSVAVKQEAFTAKGTAYKTINTDQLEGTEVYHSAISTKLDNQEVAEGKKFLKKSPVKEQENKVLDINIDELKKDEFVIWNADQDKKEAEFATALGILSRLDEPKPQTPVTAVPTTPNGIKLSGSVAEYSANFNWSVKNVDVSSGYKLVKSSKSNLPTYPDNSTAFIETGKTSYSLKLGDGVTYYFRLCAYRPATKTCDSYSNAITLTTPKKPVESVVLGGVTLSLSGSVASWTIGGTAPHGYKVVIAGSPAQPTYPEHSKKYTEITNVDLSGFALASGTYNVRVCKYTGDGCVDYSNPISYIVP